VYYQPIPVISESSKDESLADDISTLQYANALSQRDLNRMPPGGTHSPTGGAATTTVTSLDRNQPNMNTNDNQLKTSFGYFTFLFQEMIYQNLHCLLLHIF